jgi:hypothetical protein
MEGGQSGEVGRIRGEGRLYNFFMALTIIGCFVILGVSVIYYFEGYCGIFECIPLVPYRHVPVALAFLAILAKWFEKLWRTPAGGILINALGCPLPASDRKRSFTADPWWTSSPVLPNLGFRYTQVLREQKFRLLTPRLQPRSLYEQPQQRASISVWPAYFCV